MLGDNDKKSRRNHHLENGSPHQLFMVFFFDPYKYMVIYGYIQPQLPHLFQVIYRGSQAFYHVH